MFSCYIPLNAAILILVYLEHNRTLPTTHYELLYQLLLCCIDREMKTRQPKRILSTISSLDDLPHDLKKQLDSICILAYEGIMQNKVVFTQDELPSILHTPVAQEDLPTMGVLQRVQWFSISSKKMSYNFIHLSIQELLAAYCISKMKESEQVRVFQTLLGKPRFSAVLQFYAGFTKLTNQDVRNIITRTDFTTSYNDFTNKGFTSYKSSMLSLLSYMKCFCEAQICDRSFYQQIVPRLNGLINLSHTTMSPLDCLAFGYFLAFVLKNTRELCVDLSYCSIDDHSLCVLMGELSKHALATREGILHRVTSLKFGDNKIGDSGIARIANALLTSTTMRKLDINSCDISDVGAESLATALGVNRSLYELDISYNKIGNKGIVHIGNALQTNYCNSLRILSVGDETVSDQGAVYLLSSALTTDSRLIVYLIWSCIHPDSTLKEISKCVRNSKLTKLKLQMYRPQPSGEAETVEQVKEWLKCVEVGGKELMLSLENCRLLQKFCLRWNYSDDEDVSEEVCERNHRVYEQLKATAAKVNNNLAGTRNIHIFF